MQQIVKKECILLKLISSYRIKFHIVESVRTLDLIVYREGQDSIICVTLKIIYVVRKIICVQH